MEEQFVFRKIYRNIILIVIVTGLLVVTASILISGPGASRIWANILMNNVFFTGIALGAAFFIAVHRVAWSGWHIIIQKIPDSMTTFLPVALILMLLIYFGMNDLYSWTETGTHNEVLEGKRAWLNTPFFFIRMVIYFTGWIILTWMMKKSSESFENSSDVKYNTRRRIFASIFLVFFAITVSTSSWDWIMSLEPMWFSTIFGWYVFISLFVTAIAFITWLTCTLRRFGYLKLLREDHVHDLAILLFSFSIFWTYLWFAQYELIWYGHLPEETIYFIDRIDNYKFIFFLNLGINFIVPFFGLIQLHSKMQLRWVAIISIILIIGHWLDYWLMIMPPAVGENASIGLLEIFMTIMYGGIFVFVIFRSLSTGPLVLKNDPFFEESMTYKA